MVKSAKDMKETVKVAMRGGDGQVICKDFRLNHFFCGI